MSTIQPIPGMLRRARLHKGVGVRELARTMNVTPAAVTQWEHNDAKGTIRHSTRTKVLAALNTSMENQIPPIANGKLERREDRVALELHKAVAKKLIDNPYEILSLAPANISLLRSRVRGQASNQLLDFWEQLIYSQQLGKLIDVMLGSDTFSINMRQTSPFAGILTETERLEAIEKARS